MWKNVIYSIHKKFESDLRILRYLFFEITLKCNLSCLHCGSDCQKDNKSKELTTDQWLHFIDYINTQFPHGQVAIVITGGEPLIRKDFFEIADRLYTNRMPWGIVTNAYFLTDETIKKLVKRGINFLTISLDGLEENHSYLRNNKLLYPRVISAIKNVTQYSHILFDIVTCVFPNNLNELNDIAELLISLGVKRWRLFSITAKGRAETNKNLILSRQQWAIFIKWISTNRKKLQKRGLIVDFSCEGYFPKKIDNAIRENPFFCRAGINVASVLSDGSIGACPNISRTITQGNILTNDFKNVWENKFQKYYNRDWLKKGRCKDCKEWDKCRGNSLHLYDDNFDELEFCHFHDIPFDK